MFTGMLHLHSFLRWVILLLILVAIFRSISAIAGKKPFTAGDKKTGLFLMISCDIMLLIGLYLWFVGDKGLALIKGLGMGEVMKNAVTRFYVVEHMLGMIVAIALVHVGKSFAKKNIPDTLKHRRTILFFALALLVILITIPWPFREIGAGRGWL